MTTDERTDAMSELDLNKIKWEYEYLDAETALRVCSQMGVYLGKTHHFRGKTTYLIAHIGSMRGVSKHRLDNAIYDNEGQLPIQNITITSNQAGYGKGRYTGD